MRNTHPGAARDELAHAEFDERCLKVARIELVLAGARWAPDPPELPKQQPMDSIAATVLDITRWTSVDSESVEATYRWLFGGEAAFVAGAELRLEAELRMLDNPALREVRLPHTDTGGMVLVTREKILEHADDYHRMVEVAPIGMRRSCYGGTQANVSTPTTILSGELFR